MRGHRPRQAGQLEGLRCERAILVLGGKGSLPAHPGLYFLAVGDTHLLDKALGIIATEGLGTDRNVGFGFFDFTTDSITLNLPDQADYQVSLSLLIPESKEQLLSLTDSDHVAYDFIRRGGWITTYPHNTLRKNAIYAFLPGSVFRKEATTLGDAVLGRIVNLRPGVGELAPSHPIWRSGKSIMLPLIIK